MSSQPQLNDEYTNGVYYDRQAGNYCEMQLIEGTVGLCVPGRDEPYYLFDRDEYTKEEIIEEIESDFDRVSEEAVQNPTLVVERAIRSVNKQHPSELITDQFTIDLGYARDQVEIVERSED